MSSQSELLKPGSETFFFTPPKELSGHLQQLEEWYFSPENEIFRQRSESPRSGALLENGSGTGSFQAALNDRRLLKITDGNALCFIAPPDDRAAALEYGPTHLFMIDKSGDVPFLKSLAEDTSDIRRQQTHFNLLSRTVSKYVDPKSRLLMPRYLTDSAFRAKLISLIQSGNTGVLIDYVSKKNSLPNMKKIIKHKFLSPYLPAGLLYACGENEVSQLQTGEDTSLEIQDFASIQLDCLPHQGNTIEFPLAGSNDRIVVQQLLPKHMRDDKFELHERLVMLENSGFDHADSSTIVNQHYSSEQIWELVCGTESGDIAMFPFYLNNADVQSIIGYVAFATKRGKNNQPLMNHLSSENRSQNPLVVPQLNIVMSEEYRLLTMSNFSELLPFIATTLGISGMTTDSVRSLGNSMMIDAIFGRSKHVKKVTVNSIHYRLSLLE